MSVLSKHSFPHLDVTVSPRRPAAASEVCCPKCRAPENCLKIDLNGVSCRLCGFTKYRKKSGREKLAPRISVKDLPNPDKMPIRDLPPVYKEKPCKHCKKIMLLEFRQLRTHMCDACAGRLNPYYERKFKIKMKK